MGLPQGQRNGLWVEKLEDWQSHCIMFMAREALLLMCLYTPRSKNEQRPTFKEAFNWELLSGRGVHDNQFSFILNLPDLFVTKTIMHCSISPEIHHQGYLFVLLSVDLPYSIALPWEVASFSCIICPIILHFRLDHRKSVRLGTVYQACCGWNGDDLY